MTKSEPDLSARRNEFVAEFDAIADQLGYTCAELGRLMSLYRFDMGDLADAQNAALSSLAMLRKAAAHLPATGTPAKSTRPQAWTGTLAEQLDSHRAGVAQTLGLVQYMPGIDRTGIQRRTQAITQMIHDCAIEARLHQPSKARQ